MTTHDVDASPVMWVDDPSFDEIKKLIVDSGQLIVFEGFDCGVWFLKRGGLDFLAHLNSQAPVQ